MTEKKSIKIDGKIKNPCYNEKTKTDCPRRAVGCHAKCNLYKIYKTLKAVEKRQKMRELSVNVLAFEIAESKHKRLRHRLNQKGSCKE